MIKFTIILAAILLTGCAAHNNKLAMPVSMPMPPAFPIVNEETNQPVRPPIDVNHTIIANKSIIFLMSTGDLNNWTPISNETNRLPIKSIQPHQFYKGKLVHDSVNVSWNPVDNAVAYQLFYGPATGLYTQSYLVTNAATNITISVLAFPTNYFMVESVGPNNQSGPSTEVSLKFSQPILNIN